MNFIQQFRDKNILVTNALPYANGKIHLGHMVEYIQSDVWVRTIKRLGAKTYFVCADDAHGTAIMLVAEKEGISEQQLIDRVKLEHETDLRAFLVDFDNFYTTHSPENQKIVEEIFAKLYQGGFIKERVIQQLYDIEKKIFLSDRYVKGNCPKCDAENQYGDNCEVCGATYNATDLKNYYSIFSNSKPEIKDTAHLFFDLPQFEGFIQNWLKTADLQDEVVNKLQEWFDQGLKQWDITRDGPYFGFEIPNFPNKYFYVWLDAPIGYLASFTNLLERLGKLDEYDKFMNNSQKNDDYKIYHFIGKDIAYFHTLFWPSMLEGAGMNKPDGIFTHGFLTVNGKKMSKSRGTFIEANKFNEVVEAEFLRYYFATKLTDSQADLDLNFEDFVQKINSDLIGKFVNIASRTSGFISRLFDGKLADKMYPSDILEQSKSMIDKIWQCYINKEYAIATKKIMQIADLTNQLISQVQPWEMAKNESKREELQQFCTLALNMYYRISLLLSPILPHYTQKALQQFNLDSNSLEYEAIKQDLLGININKFEPFMKRIELKTMDKLIIKEENQEVKTKSEDGTQSQNQKSANLISFDDFVKLDMKLGQIVGATAVEGMDKLLELKIDVGEEKPRTIFSGIRETYPEPEKLIGKKVPVLVNLKPRKFKFGGVSEGMVLMASDDKDEVSMLLPDNELFPNGSQIN